MIDSPCNDICTTDPESGLCVGCGICQSIAGEDKIEVMMSSKGRLEPKEINKISPDVFKKI